MRRLCLTLTALFCIIGSALAISAAIEPGAFSTTAKFSVNEIRMALSTAVATIEPHPRSSGYYWVRISFYSFPLTADDIAGVMKGSTDSMEKKRRGMASKQYNNSHAGIQLSVDKSYKVWQVDMSLPGHTCTIAYSESGIREFLQDYQFDGKNLTLKSKGSYVCDMKSVGMSDDSLGWDIDVHIPVFAVVRAAK